MEIIFKPTFESRRDRWSWRENLFVTEKSNVVRDPYTPPVPHFIGLLGLSGAPQEFIAFALDSDAVNRRGC